MRDGTRVIHAGLPEPEPGEPFLPGPTFAAPYHLPVAGPQEGLDSYGRPNNRTVRALESAIGELEGGEVVTFGTGMSAIAGALLTILRPGDTVVLPADGYYETRRFAHEVLAPFGIAVRVAPTVGPYDLAGARLVLLETPANPGLDVYDIAALATAAHEAGALLAVDNTTATPLGQRPLDLGADLVVASGTKALTGHSDLLLGYAAGRGELIASLLRWRNLTGGTPGPFEAWLAHRSMGTLELRLARQQANAAAVADLLASRPEVTGLRWPGRLGDPGHEVAARQMSRYPGVVTFQLADELRVSAFLGASGLVAAATSFGGLHTTADRRAQWGDPVPPGLVRFSCGCEDTDDLIADLTAALDAASSE